LCIAMHKGQIGPIPALNSPLTKSSAPDSVS
jgi:hypothetical protein